MGTRPYPTGTPWPNRNPSTSSTSRCSGSRLPSPGRAGDAPRCAPAVIVPPASSEMPRGKPARRPPKQRSAPHLSPSARAVPLRRVVLRFYRPPDFSRGAVRLAIPPITRRVKRPMRVLHGKPWRSWRLTVTAALLRIIGRRTSRPREGRQPRPIETAAHTWQGLPARMALFLRRALARRHLRYRANHERCR